MRDYVRHILFLALILLISVTAAYCQSVSVSPPSATVALGSTIQFSATVTGIKPHTVNWFAGQVKGGNSTAGTISSTGLYKAQAGNRSITRTAMPARLSSSARENG